MFKNFVENHKKITPMLDTQIVRISENCLDLYPVAISNFSHHMKMAAWLFFPFFIVLFALYFEYDMFNVVVEAKFSNFTEKLINIFMSLFSPLLLFFMMTVGFSYVNLRAMRKSSLVRINRKTKTIYYKYNHEFMSVDFNQVSSQVKTMMSISGYNTVSHHILAFAGTGIECSKMGFHTEENGKKIPQDGRLQALEYLRIYMQEGPAKLNVYGQLLTLSSSYKNPVKFTMSLKEAIQYHWPFPVNTSRAPSDIEKMLTYMAALVLFLFFIPNVLGEVTATWLIKHTGNGKAYADLPEESHEGCDQHYITPEMVNPYLKEEERFITFDEIMKRHYDK